MFSIYGEYNCAYVMIDSIDQSTYSQIQTFLNNPSFSQSYIAIMADCHAGSGSCIGFTMPINDRIIPNVVGVDIGCAMLGCKFNTDYIDVCKLDTYIHQYIPAGFSIHNKPYTGDLFFQETIKRIGIDDHRVVRSIGTLGGGNHFIEAGYSNQDGNLWITIHSGSRNFGLQIANYYSKVAKEYCKRNHEDCRGIPFLYVDSAEGRAYIEDQQIGVRYASLNRHVMMERIQDFVDIEVEEIIESVHNFIDTDGMIRKGATSAHKGEKLIIPFNMRDGLAICEGKGNPEYNYSAPHGAGRILSRTKAKADLNVEYFQAEMKEAGVYTTTANQSTLDESPDAYKDMNLILEHIQDTVKVLEMVKPVYNFKAGGD